MWPPLVEIGGDFCFLSIQSGVLLILVVTAIINISFIMNRHERKDGYRGESITINLLMTQEVCVVKVKI